MFARSYANGFVRTFALPLPRLATVAGLVMILGPAAYAQEADAERTARKREPIVFTVDVAEELAGSSSPPWSSRSTHSPSAVRSSSPRAASSRPARSKGMARTSIPTSVGTSACGSAEARTWWRPTRFPRRRFGSIRRSCTCSEGRAKSSFRPRAWRVAVRSRRIVTGGTGNYAGWTGEQRQTFLGFNSTGGVNLRVTFILRPPAQ